MDDVAPNAGDTDRGSLASTVFAAAFALIIGAAVGFLTTFTHHQLVPWGLVAGLLIITALVAGFRIVFDSRLIAAAAGLGVLLATAVLALPGVSGTALLLDDPIGYVWAIVPTVLTAAVVIWPDREPVGAHRRRRRDLAGHEAGQTSE
ncbi:hypothetical protein BH11ACT3_BH11ACT3_02450 [soil metagenome]